MAVPPRQESHGALYQTVVPVLEYMEQSAATISGAASIFALYINPL
jgi:hypothetical protein